VTDKTRAGPARETQRGDRQPASSLASVNRAAFAALYEAHFDEVRSFVTRRVADPHTAADLTAEVFVTALGGAGSYRGEGPAGAWLTGIARHVVAAEYRRAARDRAAARRINASQLLDADDITRLEERIDAQREARQLYARIRQLPPGQQQLLELVAIDGLTVLAAAQAAGISPVTARVRLHRARRALRQLPPPPPGNASATPAPLEAQP
jgi:RNA polymerase sigma factor (sigma-70 family)